jgi:hypothetical protein
MRSAGADATWVRNSLDISSSEHEKISFVNGSDGVFDEKKSFWEDRRQAGQQKE